MPLGNTKESWGWLARLLHWGMAVLILFLLGLGTYITQFLSGGDMDTLMARFDWTQVHKSWGFVAFSLGVLRLVWRWVNPTPALPGNMGAGERFLAHAGHWGLYICILGMPLSGWLMSSASTLQELYGVKNEVFGVFEMPDPFVPGDDALAGIFGQVHFFLGIGLVVLLLGHVAAALKHHFVRRDDVLRRMVGG